MMVPWLTAAADARADFQDGLAAYDAGDLAAAFAEWRPLAEAGDTGAQVALAGLYMDGVGVARDLKLAIHWYRRAAEAGSAVAQLNLGDLYGRGVGVPRDAVRAYIWLSRAAAQGRAWADLRRSEIARIMSAAEIAEAEARLAKPGD